MTENFSKMRNITFSKQAHPNLFRIWPSNTLQFPSPTCYSVYLWYYIDIFKNMKKKSQVSIREFPVPWWINISRLTTLQKSNCCCESMNLTDYLLHRNHKLQVKLLVTLTINLGWKNQLICELIYFSKKNPNKTVSNLIIIKCSNNLSIMSLHHLITLLSQVLDWVKSFTLVQHLWHSGVLVIINAWL